MKTVYICGPLTELPKAKQAKVKNLYSRIGVLASELTGVRAFVPHEKYDPILHSNYSPEEVDSVERDQVCNKTSCLIVVAIEPTWGGGIEVEMARANNVPVLLLCPQRKLKAKRISRLLRGNPAIKRIVTFTTHKSALQVVAEELPDILRSHSAAKVA